MKINIRGKSEAGFGPHFEVLPLIAVMAIITGLLLPILAHVKFHHITGWQAVFYIAIHFVGGVIGLALLVATISLYVWVVESLAEGLGLGFLSWFSEPVHNEKGYPIARKYFSRKVMYARYAVATLAVVVASVIGINLSIEDYPIGDYSTEIISLYYALGLLVSAALIGATGKMFPSLQSFFKTKSVEEPVAWPKKQRA